VLFNRARDPAMERWLGPRAGQQGACEVFGADQAFDIQQLAQKIHELLEGRKTLYYYLGKSSSWDKTVSEWLRARPRGSQKTATYPCQLSDLSLLTSPMRLIKSEHEIEMMTRASDISALAHRKLMASCQPGMFEYQLAAQFEYEVKQQNCRSLAYDTIVGTGANACVLHYVANSARLEAGDLVLVDAGAEYENYAADITRTFPVNGKFNCQQAAIYQLVLETQMTVINMIKPGIAWDRLHEVAVLHLTRGLIDLGIIKDSLQDAIANKSYQEYFMHGTGHWLGLDVHDVGSYRMQNTWRTLVPGMVFTVEPGLYLSASERLDCKWWHIGVRIEDDVLVTKQGCEVLTNKVPKSIEEIEKLMAKQ
jgi:Xaa-Pro aminopeptidase